jgi:phosphoglycerate kinase
VALRRVADLDVGGRRVLIRSDLNVPLTPDRQVADDLRIEASLPTIRHVLDRGGRPVVCSHLGRPKGRRDEALSLAPVARRLGDLLGAPGVRFVGEVAGAEAVAASRSLPDRQVLVVENLRYEAGEEANDPAFAQRLASLGDVFVNDAFGAAHRAHASTVGVTAFLPSAAGLLLEREVATLTGILAAPERPFVALLGGSKVSDKIGVIDALRAVADRIVIGGAMCFAFLAAQGRGTGASKGADPEQVEAARRVLDEPPDGRGEIVLPTDIIAADRFDAAAETRVVGVDEMPDGWMGLDIGPETAERYAGLVADARTVLWNGPMGAFELGPFAEGTRAVARAMADNGEATTVIGGGDSAAAVRAFGLDDRMSWVSTGGGASLELLEGRTLPGVRALED